VARLLQAGLAELDGELVHLTLLGRACGASSLSFESSLRLIELMRQLNVTQVDPVQVLGTIEVLAQMDGIYTPVMKRGRSESVRAGDVAQRYGHAMAQGLQRYCRDEFEFWARCKRASILFDWVTDDSFHGTGRPVASRASPNRGPHLTAVLTGPHRLSLIGVTTTSLFPWTTTVGWWIWPAELDDNAAASGLVIDPALFAKAEAIVAAIRMAP
jgi:hypothetical protein